MPLSVRDRKGSDDEREPLKPFWSTNDGDTVRLYRSDVLVGLRGLPARSVQCVVTSPPYWGLRDYGTAQWDGGDPNCDHKHERRGNMQYLDRHGNPGRNNTTWQGAERHSTVRLGQFCKKSDGAYALYLTRGKYLTLRGTNGVWSGLPCQHYKGTVWCPKVASTFWLARRDGKPFITGNTFPKPLIEPCIRAGTSEKGCCARCGAPWRRVIVGWEPTCSCHGTFVTVKRMVKVRRSKDGAYSDPYDRDHSTRSNRNGMSSTTLEPDKVEVEIVEEERDVQEYRPSIPLEDHPTRRCLVLDPFMGSGTTAVVSVVNNCACWGIELSEEYLTENAIPRIKGLLMARPSLSHLVRVSTRPVSFSKAARKRD